MEDGGWRMGNGGWRGGQEIDLKMEANHDWSPDTRLQGRAGSLVADTEHNQQRKRLANIIRLSISKPLILAKPGPSQA